MRAHILTILCIAVILLSGCYYHNNLSLQNPVDQSYPELAKAEPYLEKILHKDMDLRNLAISITRTCQSGDKECQLNRIYRYIVDNFKYYSDPRTDEFIQTPDETLKLTGGDCEDLTILLLSLLENIGIKTYLVLTGDHAYGLACGVDTNKLMEYAADGLIQAYSTQLQNNYYTETRDGQLMLIRTQQEVFDLNRGYMSYYGGDGRIFEETIRSMKVEYKISSSQPVNIYLVPSNAEMAKLSKRLSYNHYADCKRTNIFQTSGVCNMDRNGGLIIENAGNRGATVSIDLKFNYVYATGLILRNKTMWHYNLNNEDCIVLEPTAGKGGFPGYTTILGKKTAIDPITREIYHLD